jgi:hypothetical protein
MDLVHALRVLAGGVDADPADEIFTPAGASDRATPSAIWLRAEFAAPRKRR